MENLGDALRVVHSFLSARQGVDAMKCVSRWTHNHSAPWKISMQMYARRYRQTHGHVVVSAFPYKKAPPHSKGTDYQNRVVISEGKIYLLFTLQELIAGERDLPLFLATEKMTVDDLVRSAARGTLYVNDAFQPVAPTSGTSVKIPEEAWRRAARDIFKDTTKRPAPALVAACRLEGVPENDMKEAFLQFLGLTEARVAKVLRASER